MGRKGTRRQPHASACYWKQTGCWYYTPRGTEQRVPLFDEDGNRIRGPENKQAAHLALARIKLAGAELPEAPPPGDEAWLVARVCSEYLQYCERCVAGRTLSAGHRDGATLRPLTNEPDDVRLVSRISRRESVQRFASASAWASAAAARHCENRNAKHKRSAFPRSDRVCPHVAAN